MSDSKNSPVGTLMNVSARDAVRMLAVAVALVEEREKVLGRELSKGERDWLVRKAFVHQRGDDGHEIAECMIKMMDGIGYRT